jgi:hypothetical protein
MEKKMKKPLIILTILLLITNIVITVGGASKESGWGDFYRFQLIPEDENFLDNAPKTVNCSVIVSVSASNLWKNIINQNNWTKWFKGLNKCELVSPPPINLHSKRIIQVGILKFYEDIIILQPERAFGFTILEENIGLFTRAVEAVYLEPVDEHSTRLIYRGGFEYRGIYNLFSNLIERELINRWIISFEELANISEK